MMGADESTDRGLSMIYFFAGAAVYLAGGLVGWALSRTAADADRRAATMHTVEQARERAKMLRSLAAHPSTTATERARALAEHSRLVDWIVANDPWFCEQRAKTCNDLARQIDQIGGGA